VQSTLPDTATASGHELQHIVRQELTLRSLKSALPTMLAISKASASQVGVPDQVLELIWCEQVRTGPRSTQEAAPHHSSAVRLWSGSVSRLRLRKMPNCAKKGALNRL